MEGEISCSGSRRGRRWNPLNLEMDTYDKFPSDISVNSLHGFLLKKDAIKIGEKKHTRLNWLGICPIDKQMQNIGSTLSTRLQTAKTEQNHLISKMQKY